MENISKTYGENPVLKNASLSLYKGEIHALLGENGAGKSTLMNILFGMEVIHSTGGYQGKVMIEGQEIVIDSPGRAMGLGIGMVHQEFMLIPGFTVTENIKLGREISKPTVASKLFGKSMEKLDIDRMATDARNDLGKVGLNIEEYIRVKGMPVGYMQFVEIAREIDKTGVKILVFDEPTAVLTETEASRLMEAMRAIADSGIAIIFITHRLDEVMEICDRITILRDGEQIASIEKKDTNVKQLAELMVGRNMDADSFKKKSRTVAEEEPALELEDFHVYMAGEEVRGLNLSIQKGEIFGIGGLAGQGKLGVCNGIMGISSASGVVRIFGEVLNLKELGAALKKQVAFVSEDRREVGLLLEESIALNIASGAMQVNNRFLRDFKVFKQMDRRAVRGFTEQMIKELDIRCTGYKQRAGRLSGGNQQKVCLAKALALQPQLLMVAEPTRGIDIGAKKIVLDKLVELNQEGITVIMVSSELSELRSICDRIAIITDGTVSAILKPEADDADFGLAMSGARVKGGKANG